MMKKWMANLVITMIALSLVMVFPPKQGAAEEKGPITIQFITGREGTAGYAVGASMGLLLQEEIPNIIKRVDVRPLGSLAGAKRVEKGTSEVTYINAMAMYQQYNNKASNRIIIGSLYDLR